MRICIFIFLHALMVRDVFSLKGFFEAEVTILDEGEVPSDTEDQVTCTIYSIEPAGTDVKFVKYIASREEVVAKSSSWRDNSTAQTFEDCAEAAAASGSHMFLFDERRCQISDDVYWKTNVCTKDQSQMVYMDIDAVPVTPTAPNNPTDHGLFCNYDWTISCSTGRCINGFVENENSCSEGIGSIITHEGRYHLFESNYQVKNEDHLVECEKYGSQPCAPADESSITEFVEHLEGFDSDPSIGLNSTDNGITFTWTNGVAMPKEHPKLGGSGSVTQTCGQAKRGLATITECQEERVFCCMVPYYAI